MAITLPAVAQAECQFRADFAIGCPSRSDAADAFEAFGHDGSKIMSPYGRRLLRESRCTIIGEARRASAQPMRRMAEDEVAEPSQALRVTWLDLKVKEYGLALWFANNYLSGVCSRTPPPHDNIDDDYSQDDFGGTITVLQGAYRPTGSDTVACTDPVATAKISGALVYPNSLSDIRYNELIDGFNCITLMPKRSFEVIRPVIVTLGGQRIAEYECVTSFSNGTKEHFFVLQKRATRRLVSPD